MGLCKQMQVEADEIILQGDMRMGDSYEHLLFTKFDD